MQAQIGESKKGKFLKSEEYNFLFNKENGYFMRWGKKLEDDPFYSPFGPEIADIEISTICHGLGTPCDHCYKSNTAVGENMTLETFKTIFAKFPKTLTQIAFGIGDIDGNPDMWRIFEHCRTNGIIPNVTVNGYNVTTEHIKKLSTLCGAVAVSRYNPKDVCYDVVEALAAAGMKQTNIHMVTAEENFDDCMELLEDAMTDSRLNGLNAIVFLGLKPKGKRNKMRPLKDMVKFKQIVDFALDNNIGIGFDSCSANKFLNCVDKHPNYKQFEQCVEPCESTLFSCYVNVEGIAFPCSFCEGEKGFEGINVLETDSFSGVWNGNEYVSFRESLKNTVGRKCRVCPAFDLDHDKRIKL